MKGNRLFIFLAGMLMLLSASCGKRGDAELAGLIAGFQNPPQEARPQVWWHWMDGNVTKDGIRKDLEWMHESGIAGVHIFNAGIDMDPIVDHRLVYMHDDWKDAFRYAISLADSLGMDVTIASSPGWSCMGGPWVEPADAMKKLVWRSLTVEGGSEIDLSLPDGYSVAGRYLNNPDGDIQQPFYEDIAVVAVRLEDSGRRLAELGARLTSSSGKAYLAAMEDDDYDSFSDESWIQYEFPSPQTFRNVTLADNRPRRQWANAPGDTTAVLSGSVDGLHYFDIVKIPSSTSSIQTVTFEPVSARFFRLAYKGSASRVYEFQLGNSARVNHASEKAAFAAPHDLAAYPTPVGISASRTVVLTDRFKDGRLVWDAPEGRWKIYRFGYSLTGKKNTPAPDEATGLEVDKLDPDAWSRYFHAYLDMCREAAGGLMGEQGIRNLLTDSYEAGQENWTPALAEQFLKRRGYDLVPWLPALAGEVLEDSESTESFLFDFRKTLGELVAENYDRLNDIIREYGLKGRWTESHENGRVYVVDGMDVKRSAMVPMSAFWKPGRESGGSTIPMGIADIRESASVAHLYGQKYVAAESFTTIGTGGQAYSFCPENLKPVLDMEFAHGLNRLVVHESAHQPDDVHVPGLGLLKYGQWFNRHDTWAPLARHWMDYAARSSYMLQQGRYVADILFYYGEDSNVTAQYGFGLPDVPDGYAFDFISPSALTSLLDLGRDGRLTVPGGMEYSVLVLDRNCGRMSPEVIEKLRELASGGARIVTNGWADLEGRNIYDSLEEALEDVPADYETDVNLDVVHRDLGKIQIWWVSNPSDGVMSATVSFNVHGLKPQLWDPVTGRISDVSYRMTGSRTEVELDLVQHDAVFVVFAGKGDPSSVVAKPVMVDEISVPGPWHLSFDSRFATPGDIDMAELESLSLNADDDVRYFSGTASYTAEFNFSYEEGTRVMLDLGDVKNIARVSVNGSEPATLWKAPFVCDVTDLLVNGSNNLEVKVTNLWPNRLIGDLQPGAARHTYTGMQFYEADSPLLPSGLLGPVRLEIKK